MNSSAIASVPPQFPPVQQQPNADDLVRVFNTALLTTRAGAPKDVSAEIYELMEHPAYRAILGAVRQHARLQGLGERQAAEQIISTFRKMDELWRDYVFNEGVERLKNPV